MLDVVRIKRQVLKKSLLFLLVWVFLHSQKTFYPLETQPPSSKCSQSLWRFTLWTGIQNSACHKNPDISFFWYLEHSQYRSNVGKLYLTQMQAKKRKAELDLKQTPAQPAYFLEHSLVPTARAPCPPAGPHRVQVTPNPTVWSCCWHPLKTQRIGPCKLLCLNFLC